MSTFAYGPVIFVTATCLAVAAVALLRAGGPPQPATRPVRTGRGRSWPVDPRRLLWMAATAESDRRNLRRARSWWAEAMSRRGPEPAVTGDAARLHWWERLRAAVLLLVLLVALGLALAAAIGVLVFLAGFFLELATK